MAVSALCGLLLLVCGSRLLLYEWKDTKLFARAFFDCQFYVMSVKVIKNFIVYGDVTKGVHLLLWDEGIQQVIFLAKTELMYSMEAYAVEFVLEGDKLCVLGIDNRSNLTCFSISVPELIPIADVNLGVRTHKLLPLLMKPSLPAVKAPPISSVALGAGLDGALQLLWPAQKDVYNRLHSLDQLLNFAVAHVAGLNPQAFRLLQPLGPEPLERQKNVVDCGLIWSYLSLDRDIQYLLAQKIGTSPDLIIENLRVIAEQTSLC